MKKESQLFLKRYLSIALIGLFLFTSSCKKKDDPVPEPDYTENITVNEWVTENMRIYYYWNEGIPSDRRLNFKLDPAAFFETIRNKNPNDRFSWIANSSELKEQLGGVSTSTGMKVSLMNYDCDGNGNNCKKVFGIVRYVIPNSPAATAGVERGMMFTSVNGTKLTPSNYVSVFADPYDKGKGFKITIATLANNTLTETNTTYDLSTARVEEPSVYLSKVLTTPISGKKVGYIFYNTFLNSKVSEVFDAFEELKGVSDLILDLRYNLGGGISVAGVMAALIKQGYSKEQVFVKYTYNNLLNREFDKQGKDSRNESFNVLYDGVTGLPENTPKDQKETAVLKIENKVKNANLNLPRVFILATGNSASASELVIHNLRPYMGRYNVIHIGDTTIGKNEGSFTIEDDRKPKIVDWAIQPIVVKLADKEGNGDYDTGLVPDHLVDEFDTLPLLPLGNEADPLIAKALQLIDPHVQRRSKMIQPEHGLQKAAFSQLNEFNKRDEARPVQVDGTIDKNIIKRIKENIN